MVNRKKKTSLKKQVMLVLLLVPVLALVAVGVKPVQASNLLAYAQAYARAPSGVPFTSQDGPNPWGSAFAAASTAPVTNVISSVSVNVRDVSGVIRGGPLYLYLTISVGGNGSVLTWFDPASAFIFDDGGIEVWATWMGGTIRAIVGMTVRDDTGLLLDVRMECGFVPGVGRFINVIENVGRWPNNWEAVVWAPNNFILRQRAFSLGFAPAGNAKATWYATGQINSSEGESLKIVKPFEEELEIVKPSVYELFGPRLDMLLFNMYASDDAEFTALENGEIDIIDSPLTEDWITKWSSSPHNESIVLSFYGSGWKAYRRYYSGLEMPYSGLPWAGMVNQAWFGVNSWGTFLSAHPEGFEGGDGQNMTIRYGLSSPSLHMLNPIYSTSYWDWQVLDKIYDTLIIRNASAPPQSMPWLAVDWDVGDWKDPRDGMDKTKIRYTLRPEATWSDGKPITVADVCFTLLELPHILQTRGFPPPSWIGSVQEILDFKILDPYNFEVLLDVLDPLALNLIGGNIILPKHIWKPIVQYGDPTAFAPDPNLIGSGPWRFGEYTAYSHVLMYANNPGSTVQTNLPSSTPVTSPQGYWRYHPLIAGWKIDTEIRRKIDYYTQPHTTDFTVTNLWYGGPITIDLWWQITWYNGTTTEETYTNITLQPFGQPGDTWTHTDSNVLKGRIKIDTEIKIKDPQKFAGSARSTLLFYATIKEDIAGRTLYDDIGLPAYPYKGQLSSPDIKVDIKDIAIAAKAFGSYPGYKHWSTVADINADYKIDIKDIASIAKKYGWVG